MSLTGSDFMEESKELSIITDNVDNVYDEAEQLNFHPPDTSFNNSLTVFHAHKYFLALTAVVVKTIFYFN